MCREKKANKINPQRISFEIASNKKFKYNKILKLQSMFNVNRRCNIIIALNVYAPNEDKGDGVKDSFYEDLGRLAGEGGGGVEWIQLAQDRDR
jgi:hypothetical protein